MGVIFALMYALSVGIGKIFLKRSFKEFPSSVTFAAETAFGLMIWIPFGVLHKAQLSEIIEIFPVVLISAILSEAYIFYIYTKGKLSIIVSVFMTYSVYTILFSYIFFKETLAVEVYALVAICLLGVVILSLPDRKDLSNSKEVLLTAIWGTSGAIAVGLSDSISAYKIKDTSAAAFLFCLGIAQVFVSYTYLKIERQSVRKSLLVFKSYRDNIPLLTSGLCIALGQLFFWLAFENEKASIISPITTSQVIFTVILAVVFLNEKLNLREVIGILTVTISILFITILK